MYKLSQNLNIWSQRSLTIIGKTLITKSVGLSNLVYSFSCISSHDSDLKQAQTIINRFIWSTGNANKIKHSTMIGDYDRG